MAQLRIIIETRVFKLTLRCLDELARGYKSKFLVIKVHDVVKCVEERHRRKVSNRLVYWSLVTIVGMLKGKIVIERSTWVFFIPRSNLLAYLRNQVVTGDGHE